MIIEENYIPNHKNKDGKRIYSKSKVKCDNCKKERIVLKTDAKKDKTNLHICKKCVGVKLKKPAKYNLKYYLNVAEELNLELISKEIPSKCTVSVDWECKTCGYSFSATISNLLRQKFSCLNCQWRPPITQIHIKNLTKEMNFEILKIYEPVHSKCLIDLKCKHGHIFSSKYCYLVQDRGCPRCSSKGRVSKEEYLELANKLLLEITFIGENTHQDSIWKCQKEHIFNKPFHEVLNSTGCPICYFESQADLIPFYKREQNKWAASVKKRFNYCCQKCSKNIEQISIHAHHIRNKGDNPEFKYEYYNGISLCGPCHYLFHSLHGRKNNDEFQLFNFLIDSPFFAKYQSFFDVFPIFNLYLI